MTHPDSTATRILRTDRLTLRELAESDADFIHGLLNEPSFLRYIGDRGVRTPEDARAYIRNGPMASYAAHGFGLWLVVRNEDGAPLGMCGLLKREALDDVDLGFAYRPAFWRQGYAVEAGRAVLDLARDRFGLERVVAITLEENTGSIAVLQRLGFAFERVAQMPGDDATLQLLARSLG